MLVTRQLHATLAREVVGLRLWEHLDDATVAELGMLYAKYGVLVFRRQALSEAELVAFCALFGQPECTVRSDWASPTTPEVTVLSNLKDGLGRPIGGLGDGELQWHSDPTCLGRRQVGRSTRWNCRPRAERPSGSICGPPMRPCRGSFARGSPASAPCSITRGG